MNYKVGDKIIIQKPSKEQLKSWSNTWINEMDYYIGIEYIIDSIGENSFTLKTAVYSFPLCMLDISTGTHYEIY